MPRQAHFSPPAKPTAPSRPFGFAIVGSGMIAHYHARAIAATAGARLVGIASRNAETAQKLADEARSFLPTGHAAPTATTDLATLLAHPEVDVVCVATPSGAHLEPALAAIAAAKHLVIEKPLEITTARIDQLLAAALAADVVVAPIFQARFGKNAQHIKAALDAGRFGRIVLASAYVKWFREPAYYRGWKGTRALDGGGATMNQAIHGIDLLQWFVGMPTQVVGHSTRRVHTGIESEDTAVAALRYPSGALGTIEASTAAYPGWARRIEICGEHGSVTLEDDALTRWDFRDKRPEDSAILAAAADSAMGSGATNPSAISAEGHTRQIRDLVAHLSARREGRAELPRLGIEAHEARNAVSLIRALYDSASQGSQPVSPA
ncbi:hypothetical protein AXK12_03950 [Cephaloticoccus capnophilus]|uniref:Oxidoreductase n=1 Tax=Cephaloticoccus capnophilus TaxID=1548208 RepID=A0A139SNP0_9BACT|nr:Gfo/Idh/MocA family oxidoreductase [Cephaloticoccus capnophilus]KXU36176.1 hypothetical protein AXK12_03950 [Cephaloticoccus capnophilus]